MFSVFYAAATWVQSWRLSSLKNRILQLTSQNGSVVLYKVPELITDVEGGIMVQVPSVSSQLCENVDSAKLGDLLWSVGNKRLCSIFPKQTVCASRWISFSPDRSQFPLPVSGDMGQLQLSEDKLHILVEADFQADSASAAHCLATSEFCQLEKYGVLRAWKAGENFGILLESDVEHLTELGVSFMQNTLSLEDGMEVLRIETVDVNGEPCPLLNADSIPVPRSLQQPRDSIGEHVIDLPTDVVGIVQPPPTWLLMSPVQWHSHVELLRSFSAALERDLSSEVSGLVMTSDRTPSLVPASQKEAPPTPPSSPHEKSPPVLEPEKTETKQAENGPTAIVQEVPVVTETQESLKSSGITSHSDSFYSCASHETGKLSESLEHLTLTQALAIITDEHTNGANGVDEEHPSPLPIIQPKSSQETISGISQATSLDSRKFPSFRGSTASLPSSATPRSRSPSSPIKFPNVLVLSDSSSTQENVKALLRHTLKKYRYTVYSVNAEQLKGSAWQVSTALVVICGSVPDSLVTALTSYLLRGGKLLCLCSDLLHMVLPEFRTAEVRTNELVTFSYQRWKKIKMLHHVFCYQQSPVHSRFGDQNTKGLTPATAVELKDREGLSHKLDVSVLGVEETWHTPSLILAKSSAGGGKVIFSQVHLEVDPLQYESDNTTYASLKQSNTARLEIMRDILGTQLGLECAEGSKEATPTMGYFLGRHELKSELLTSVKSRLGSSGNMLEMDHLVLQFCGKGVTPSQPSHSILPVMLHSCPPHFNTLKYFDNLTTEALGRLVIYADVMTSSMEPLSGAPLWHGMAAVPRQQLSGRGRGSNEWLSPEGCGMFTLQLHLPLNSNLGRRVSLIQHITALAIVIAIREAKGYEDIDLRLKWPNDIYAGNWAKVGGLIVTSSIMGQKVCCNIGCALNLANSEPTTCIQDLLRECNSNAPPLTLEKYLALTFSRLESMIEAAQNTDEGLDEILKVYYAYWLHSGTSVTVLSEDGTEQKVEIQGLDDYGFLLVKGADGKTFSVHPDGNSFDMLAGLIRPKT